MKVNNFVLFVCLFSQRLTFLHLILVLNSNETLFYVSCNLFWEMSYTKNKLREFHDSKQFFFFFTLELPFPNSPKKISLLLFF